ncbi:MAG: acetyl/propionyl/methylcrotonyl-CoA carboxylase subunit alpha, partial [bacterium]
RGEIAVRILRTCREMGIRTVAIYSDADAAALHTRLADECCHVGASPVSESYLQQDKIIEIARAAGADAIHPGYGFLSENPVFAEKVEKAGLIFIGPPASAMRMMGDKTEARKAMQSAGVPIVPGTAEPLSTIEQAEKIAQQVGYPVLLKAAAGGGGKGMRIVAAKSEMASSFRAASSEAQSAFGDGRVYIEKYLEQPRHIEFQVLADGHGNAIHLGERECSIQRRHQKVIEEAPSAILDVTMRHEMGEAAVKAALACGYTNAGTIEFLVDKHRNFYFLEMNTRLQVEHPVTEMVTGLDLVRLQVEIAMGKKLPLQQSDLRFHGHALECRIYAEDPENNFLPSIGTITHLYKPDGPGIRDDSGITAGDEISLYYDPMIAKLVAWGENRDHAMARMRRALFEYRISGVMTTIPFCAWVLDHPRFRSADFDTHFVKDEFFDKNDQQLIELTEIELHAAAIAAALQFEKSQQKHTLPVNGHPNNVSGWRRRGWKEIAR